MGLEQIKTYFEFESLKESDFKELVNKTIDLNLSNIDIEKEKLGLNTNENR